MPFEMKKIMITIALAMTMAGCSKFTEVDLPQDQITRDLIFKDEGLANSAMAGIYRSVESSGFLSGSSSGAQSYLSCYTDELTSYAAAGSDNSQFFNLTHNALTPTVNNLWTVSYNQIYNMNSMVEGMEQSTQLSQAFRQKLRGEALFLRAMVHLYLTNTYGDIPFISTTAYEQNQQVIRLPQTEVYAKIKADLTQAAIDLPATLPKGSRVKPTKMAAYALMARLAYYQEQWDDAVRYSSLVINDVDYAIETSIDRTFLKDSNSAIWQLMPSTGTSATQQGNFFVLRTAPPARVALSQDLIAGFEAGDQRRTKWVGEIKDSQGKTYYYPFKYKQFTVGTASSEYSVVFRVEELYLIRAEGYIQQGQPELAKNDLNKLRLRVGLSALTGIDQDMLMAAVQKERRYELFVEFGHRFYDLKHFKVIDQVMTAVKPNWKTTYQLLPVPEPEMLLNPNLNPQNNGY
ncbi:MAG: RagB/SusD family nutrient uptake outer membrane protein [Pedobacter sp.]|nr:MAG: RagB/SusD family nutrient uptake outer membrane protein [Pedobacter sp.]